MTRTTFRIHPAGCWASTLFASEHLGSATSLSLYLPRRSSSKRARTRSWEVTDDHRSHWEFFQSIFKNFLLTEGPSGRSAMLVRIRLRPLAVSAIQERPPGATPDRSPLDLLGNELGHQILDKLVSFFSCPITLVRGVPRCTLYTFATLPHGICKEKK